LNNIIFFGPPGAGKGTQAKLIAQFLKLPHLSTGEILRQKTEQDDDLAIELRKIMSAGQLVSDDILNKIVFDKLANCKSGFILDGYPRTLEQSSFLNNFLTKLSLNLHFIFNIDIDFETLKMRIHKRSLEENRDDDNADVVETRFNAYINTTKKVSDYYKNNQPTIFYEINGNNEIEKITSKIIKILEK